MIRHLPSTKFAPNVSSCQIYFFIFLVISTSCYVKHIRGNLYHLHNFWHNATHHGQREDNAEWARSVFWNHNRNINPGRDFSCSALQRDSGFWGGSWDSLRHRAQKVRREDHQSLFFPAGSRLMALLRRRRRAPWVKQLSDLSLSNDIPIRS